MTTETKKSGGEDGKDDGGISDILAQFASLAWNDRVNNGGIHRLAFDQSQRDRERISALVMAICIVRDLVIAGEREQAIEMLDAAIGKQPVNAQNTGH